jgi:AP-3 complex subunit beta
MLQQLLAGVVPGIGAADARDVGGVVLRRAQVRVVLFEGKADAGAAAAAAAAAQDDGGDNDDGARRARERLGTVGLVLGRDVPNGRMLPDWLEHGVESSLRASPDDAPATPAAVTAIGHVATPGASTSRAGGVGSSGGHSTPMVVLTPAGSGRPSPVGSVPNKSGSTDLEKFYASDSEEEEEDEDEDEEEDEDESEDEESEDQSGREEDDRATGAPRTSEEKDDGEEDEDEDDVGDVEQDASSKMDPVR